MGENLYYKMREKAIQIIKRFNIQNKKVKIKSKVLTPEEAIGNPLERDYPLVKGREKLLQAEFNGAKGVAFTDMYGNFEAELLEILNMELNNNFKRAIFISTLNALLKYVGLVSNTIHCKDQTPVKCAKELPEFLNKFIKEKKIKSETVNILQVGFQPRFSEVLTRYYNVNIIDLDPENIGKVVNGVKINDESYTDFYINKVDILFVTGSTFVNNTAEKFLKSNKNVIFYGVSCASPCFLLDYERYCPYSLI